MNREYLNEIKQLLEFEEIKAISENEYCITDKAITKLIDEIKKLRAQIADCHQINPYSGWVIKSCRYGETEIKYSMVFKPLRK